MKRELLQANFIATLQKKVPGRSKLTNLLMDVLQIEKEAIYRRLRGEVPFSFAEVAVIAERLAISLDEIIGIRSEKTKNFVLQLSDFENSTEIDFVMWENYNQVLSIFNHHKPFSVFETWTTIPFPLCYKYPHLARFYFYKWAFQVHNHIPLKKYEQFIPDERIFEIGLETCKERAKATDTYIILSDTFILDFVKDILFFRNSYLLNKESAQFIRKELEEFINYLELMSEKGCYPETGEKVSLYISEINIQTNFTLYEANNNYISMLRTLVLNAAASTDEASYQYMKNWFVSLRRLSTHISVSGEKDRVTFFKKQREIIDTLNV